MSQAKVDYRKEQKKNIKKTVRTRKITTILRTTIVAIVLVAAVAWLGYSGVSKYMDYKETNAKTVSTPVDLTAISDYLTNASAEE
ncbi:MAG: hypothetical protein K6B14_03305 [Lachnospiraceae bacterium]|nr:hypothetical protein [Lachnospiraceae bacterium]